MSIRLEGLADSWEAESSIRFCSRQTGRLVQWPDKPDAVGIPSMSLAGYSDPRRFDSQRGSQWIVYLHLCNEIHKLTWVYISIKGYNVYYIHRYSADIGSVPKYLSVNKCLYSIQYHQKAWFTPFRTAVKMNIKVLKHASLLWVEIFDYEAAGTPRTPPLSAIHHEAQTGYAPCSQVKGLDHGWLIRSHPVGPCRWYINTPEHI